MLTSKLRNLKPLIESKHGIHLTAYLVNRGDLSDLKSQLSDTINEAYEWINGVMSTEERKKFLEPLDSLLHDAEIFKQMKGNIGLFRNEDSFRVLNIPIPVERMCQVATSFHVKPLLRWLQGNQEFLLLGMEKHAAHLYIGCQESFKRVDSISFPQSFETSKFPKGKSLANEHSLKQTIEAESFSSLNGWIAGLTKNSQPKLFFAGEPLLIQALNRNLKYKAAVKTPIANFFSPENASVFCQSLRKILREDSQRSLEKSLREFQFAEIKNRSSKNIFQISKAVVQGRVQKLIVTDELNIFGKIDQKSGELSLHPFDLDHEDDCILDDLAQMVLNQGGEVVVAKREQIPKGRPIIAILDDDKENLEKIDELPYEVFQERSG